MPNRILPTLKRILAPLASLRLTVILLALSMILIYAGTWAQVDTGSWQVQKYYFHNAFIWIDFQTLWPRPKPGHTAIPGGFPMLGGYVLGALLLVNLIAAHTIRFKFTWKRSGMIMIHGAMIALLAGEGITANMAVESRMSIQEGESKNYSQDIRTCELAVIDRSPADHDKVTVISAARTAKGGVIHDPNLPFDLRVDAFYPNSSILGPQQMAGGKFPQVTAGEGKGLAAKPIAGVNGLGGAVDLASAYVTPVVAGKPADTYLLSVRPLGSGMPQLDGPQSVTVDGKTYDLHLRFKRLYKPYSIHLDKFSFDRYDGTDMARNFSSDVRLVDPSTNTDRTVRIWMNHPLRYAGETFYQSGFDEETEKGTVLQIVSNPGWVLPYLACGVGALGLLIHFGMRLLGFIDKQAKSAANAERARSVPVAVALSDARSRRSRKPQLVELAPQERSWITRPTVLAPAILVGLCLVYVISHLKPPEQPGPYNLSNFATLPVSFEGRVQPYDSLARNSLKVISGRETLAVKGDKRIPAVQWLLDVACHPERAEEYEVFRIDHPDVISLMKLDPNKKLFSLKEMRATGQELLQQWQLASKVPSDDRDLYQRKIMELAGKINMYRRLERFDKLLNWTELYGQAIMLREQEQAGTPVDASLRQRIARSGAMLEQDLEQTHEDTKQAGSPILAVPPILGNSSWVGLDTAILERVQKDGHFDPAARPLIDVLEEYRADDATAFNTRVASYATSVRNLSESSIVAFEVFFNRFDPFTQSMVFYVLGFILVCASWLGSTLSTPTLVPTGAGRGWEEPSGWRAWARPVYASAIAVVIFSLLIHTFGLVARIVISGHPPVTNLASSAIFIAWGVVILALGLEWFFRNGVGLVTATAVGFLSLLVSHKLSLDGDTMKPLQAVLDTNFWLATHVVCVTLGYSATFLAGFLGVLYVILGVFTPALDKDSSKMMGKMIYGIVCFAILFSFVGTVLGGIWADQSWGRFWGWDPKENGAVLIVLCNALLLHARWGGMVRERGVAMLAIFGNIVTSWSWFGTNMLGKGLHSYGFMESALMWLLVFVASQVALILIGCIPLSYWAMTRDNVLPPGNGRATAVPKLPSPQNVGAP